MNPKVKEKWVEALRSGRYKQGYQQLRCECVDDATYCCLGVLCDLHSIETGTPWYGVSYLKEIGVLPIEVVEWAGLSHHNPIAGKSRLSSYNDNVRTGFNEIADLIEQYL